MDAMANDTLALTVPGWDLDLDSRGNIRTVGDATPGTQTGPGMRLAQDVASRVRAWLGEVWFDVNQGIDYPRYLGQAPSLTQLRADFQNEAVLVPLCATAIADFDLTRPTRTVTGSLYLTDLNGFTAQVII